MSERASAAQAILAIPLFSEIMDEIEAAAVNSVVSAVYNDHEARQAGAASIRAIRNLRSRIEVISREDQPIDRKQAPA